MSYHSNPHLDFKLIPWACYFVLLYYEGLVIQHEFICLDYPN